MTIEQLANEVLIAHGLYGIPRSTKDVDVVLSLATGNPIDRVVR